MTELVRIRKSRYRSPDANDWGIYTPDISHGLNCRCCTPINPKTEKRRYRKKNKEEAG